MHASRERLRLARTRRRRGRALADGLSLVARCRPSCYVLPEAVWPYARTSRATAARDAINADAPDGAPPAGNAKIHSTPSRDDGVERRDKRAPKRNARCGGQMRWRSLSVLHARHRKGSPQEVMSSPRPMGATANRWPSSTSALSRMVVLAWEMSWPASRSSLAEKAAAEKAAAAKAAAQQRERVRSAGGADGAQDGCERRRDRGERSGELGCDD